MRGFTKAAALLSSTLTSVLAFVIPEPAPSSLGGLKSTVEYRELRYVFCHKTKLMETQYQQKLWYTSRLKELKQVVIYRYGIVPRIFWNTPLRLS